MDRIGASLCALEHAAGIRNFKTSSFDLCNQIRSPSRILSAFGLWERTGTFGVDGQNIIIIIIIEYVTMDAGIMWPRICFPDIQIIRRCCGPLGGGGRE